MFYNSLFFLQLIIYLITNYEIEINYELRNPNLQLMYFIKYEFVIRNSDFVIIFDFVITYKYLSLRICSSSL